MSQIDQDLEIARIGDQSDRWKLANRPKLAEKVALALAADADRRVLQALLFGSRDLPRDVVALVEADARENPAASSEDALHGLLANQTNAGAEWKLDSELRDLEPRSLRLAFKELEVDESTAKEVLRRRSWQLREAQGRRQTLREVLMERYKKPFDTSSQAL